MLPKRIVKLEMDASCFEETKVKTKVYCVETKTLLRECDSRREASAFAGVPLNTVVYAVKRKARVRKNKLGRTICFR
jgi:hypothetical protein